MAMQVRFVVPLLSMVCIVLTFVLTFVRCGGSPFTFYKMDVNGDGAIVSMAIVSIAIEMDVNGDGECRDETLTLNPEPNPNPDPTLTLP